MKKTAMTGTEAVANAMRQIDPDVVPAYPITPQTEIMHGYAKFLSDGKVTGELIRVESEHSAMSASVGASCAGARVMTATAANGLALMWEIVYIAASMRLPIVMSVVNRALSGPINIHCDHSDSMGCRDSGWIQMYAENNQEAYENAILGMRLAEKARLPVMSCLDGFITSHAVEPVTLFEDQSVKDFIGEHIPDHPLLDTDNPTTHGPLDLFDYYFEHKRKQSQGMFDAKSLFKEVAAEYNQRFGRDIKELEEYSMDDAETVIVALSSTCGTAKVVVDSLREQGKKVGLLKLRLFRPFPMNEIKEALKSRKVIAVLDRVESFGAFGGPLFSEIRSALYESGSPKIVNYIYGLGGREIDTKMIERVYEEIESYKNKEIEEYIKYLGVRE
ncbi:pyruvate ferredoxin oxidoreductase [Candidatus Woesearchaeota archaeon]|nr:pyruvate ferredoxin oxidoreductase [Candidatus Woesearchaeota archaeon]